MLKIDAILKNGQPSAHVLSYDQWATRSRTSPLPAMTSPTSRIQPRPPVAQAMIAAIVATDRRAGELHRQGPDDQRQDAREQRAGQEVHADDVDAGHGRGDRAMEVGEPVIGQRLAGEVRDLGREVAGRDARADRDVDEEVAPVPAARHPAVGRLDPAVRAQHEEDHQARGDRHDPGRRVRPKGACEARPGRSCQRGEPATPDEREPDAGERQEHGRHDDRSASEAADPGDDVHQVGRDVDAGDDRGPDRTRDRQARHDPADDDPARDEEQDRPDQDDRAQRHRPGDEAADEDGEQRPRRWRRRSAARCRRRPRGVPQRSMIAT